MHDLPLLLADADSRITTPRLELEPLLPAHASALYPILADISLYEFTGGSPPFSETALAELYTRRLSRRSPDGKELWLNWLIRTRDPGIAIGYVQATVSPAHAQVAWVVGAQWQGRGYASEAAQALVGWLQRLRVPQIRACVNPRHAASQKVARNAGLRRTDELCENEEVWVSP